MFKGGGKAWQTGRALTRALPSGEVFVVVQHSEAAASLSTILPGVVAAIFASALLSGLGATVLFARQTAARLAKTQAAADAIALGDLSALNRMLDRMEEMMRLQRHFAGALAHDLRTPLTRLRGLLTAELSLGETDRFRLIERAERECDAVIAIFDSLLRLAEIESGRHPSARTELCLAELIEDIAETMEPVIVDHGSKLELGSLDRAMISGDAGLLNQLLINLLENVATHTPPGTCATLSLTCDKGTAVIALGDNGPGLPEDDRARVMRAFERGTGAAQQPGSGLGLAIAQAIVRYHDGNLQLADNAPGLRVRIAALASLGREEEARAAARQLLAASPGVTATALTDAYRDPDLRARYAAILVAAGLPD